MKLASRKRQSRISLWITFADERKRAHEMEVLLVQLVECQVRRDQEGITERGLDLMPDLGNPARGLPIYR